MTEGSPAGLEPLAEGEQQPMATRSEGIPSPKAVKRRSIQSLLARCTRRRVERDRMNVNEWMNESMDEWKKKRKNKWTQRPEACLKTLLHMCRLCVSLGSNCTRQRQWLIDTFRSCSGGFSLHVLGRYPRLSSIPSASARLPLRSGGQQAKVSRRTWTYYF